MITNGSFLLQRRMVWEYGRRLNLVSIKEQALLDALLTRCTEASDNITYEYLRATRRQRSVSVQPLEASHDRSPSHTRSPSPTADELDGDSGAESAASDGDKFRLTLRSAKTKDITLTVRPTTTCGAIVKAFLKKAGLPEQHAGTAKGMGRKGRASAPSLMVDGEKMNSASEIGDADLEDGDLVEVVGL